MSRYLKGRVPCDNCEGKGYREVLIQPAELLAVVRRERNHNLLEIAYVLEKRFGIRLDMAIELGGCALAYLEAFVDMSTGGVVEDGYDPMPTLPNAETGLDADAVG